MSDSHQMDVINGRMVDTVKDIERIYDNVMDNPHMLEDVKTRLQNMRQNAIEMQVDHIISLKRGGTNDIENLNPSCRSCNHYKSTLTLEQFREMIWNIPDRLMHQSVAYQVGSRFDLFTTNQLAKKKRLFYFEKLKQKDIEVPRKAWKNAALDTATGRSKSMDQ